MGRFAVFPLGNIGAFSGRSGAYVPDRELLQHIHHVRGRMFPNGNMGAMAAIVDTPIDLGRTVRATRLELGLTQDDLALASGTGRRFIVNLESGKATVRLDSVLAVLEALGLRIELHRGRAPQGGGPDAGA